MKTALNLGAALRARRKKLKLTQRDLAMTCGMGARFIGDLERGKATCQLGKVLEVIHALGLRLSLSDLAHDNAQGAAKCEG